MLTASPCICSALSLDVVCLRLDVIDSSNVSWFLTTWTCLLATCRECWKRKYGTPGTPSDIFAFGLMLWEMVARSRIYKAFPGFEHDDEAPTTVTANGQKQVDVAQIAMRLAQGQRPAATASCPKVLHTLMRACWVHDIDTRLTAAELHSIIKCIRNEEPGVFDEPAVVSQAEISYSEFLEQLGLKDREDDLAEYLTGDALVELKQMDPDALDDDIINDVDLGFSEAQKVQFRAAVEALPHSLPPDPYAEFLTRLNLEDKKEALADYLSKPGNELIELVQVRATSFLCRILTYLEQTDGKLTPNPTFLSVVYADG